MSVIYRRRVSYNGSYWQAWQQVIRDCGYLDLGVSGAHVWIEFAEIQIPDGEQYKITNNGHVMLDITGPVVNGEAAFEYGAGTPSGAGAWSEEVICIPPCLENSDCEENEKCLNGNCVPCSEQQATHFQIRAEFDELVTLPDDSQTMYLLSSIYPIGDGVDNQIIQLAECNGVWYYPRIRFCDSSGVAKPYSGNVAMYGYCNPDGSNAMWVNTWTGVVNKSWLIGQRAQMDLHFASPLSVPRMLVEFIDKSEIIYETDCSGVNPEEPPEIEPVEPTEPVEPDEPTEPDEPIEPTEPTKPTEPDAPQTGCECEIYIGEQIARAANILYDGIILLKREMSVGFRELVVEMYEARKLNYQLSMFLQNQQYQVLLSQHQRLYEILQAIQKGLIKDDDGLIDIVKKGLVEGEDGLIDIVKEFADQYEPVTIENEYRTQSHRVIDNLDEVANKL